MTNNKKFLAPFFVAMSMLLVACSSDTIVARPSWQNDSIIDVEGLKDNKLKEIYDAVKNLSETNPNILNKVMFNIAKKQIGSYADLFKFASDTNEETKKTIVASPEFRNFVDAHPIYKSESKTYQLVDGHAQEMDVPEKSDLAYSISFDKIANQFKKIKETIFEKIYNDIVKNADYVDDGKLFKEEYFVYDYLVPNMFIKKSDIKVPEGPDKWHDDKPVMPKNIGDSWENCVNTYIHANDETGYCGFNTNLFYSESSDPSSPKFNEEDGYIGRKLLPEIYRNLLVDTYVREQRYSNLGRAQARKIKMISIDKTRNKGDVRNLLEQYIKDTVLSDKEFDFNYVNELIVGYAKTSDTVFNNYLSEIGGFLPLKVKNPSGDETNLIWSTTIGEDGKEGEEAKYNVYKGTKLGDLVEKYISLFDITWEGSGETIAFNYELKEDRRLKDDDKKFLDELTDNNNRSYEDGLKIKERELRATDMTTDGWFLKDGGLSELNDTYKNRLFSVNTVNIVDDVNHNYSTDDYVRYMGNTSKAAFLTDDKASADEDKKAESIILNGDDKFYIVNVEEAANTKKLSSLSESGNYLQIKAGQNPGDSNAAMDEIVTNIVQKAASSDTYKKNAEQYYLMISNIVINDDSVYEYFKSQFPDLFK